ncbi:MAG TPA: hypothetical protein PK322_02510 [Opitutaceae bacterium]|nr:hypothetical protein [Opitutaceae bacterium]
MKTLLYFLMFAFACTQLQANEVKAKGRGDIEYSSLIGGANKDYRRAAIGAAKVNAIRSYVASFDTAHLSLYERVAAVVEGNADDYVVAFTILSEEDDRAKKIYRIAIEATVNGDKIEARIQESAGDLTMAQSEKAEVLFVFVAREQTSVTEFKTRDVNVSITETAEAGGQRTEAAGDAVSQTETSRIETSTTTGGSQVRKSDKIEWNVTTAASLDAAVSARFSQAGYEVLDSGTIIDTAPLKEEFRHGDDLSFSTQKAVVDSLRNEEVRYLALGTLDVGIKSVDPVSGGVRVVVNVNAKILDLGGKRARVVAAVGPVQYAGLGADQTEAKNNALKVAGEKAAQALIDTLRVKQVH